MPTPGPGSIQDRTRIYWPRRSTAGPVPRSRPQDQEKKTHPRPGTSRTCQGSELKSGGGWGRALPLWSRINSGAGIRQGTCDISGTVSTALSCKDFLPCASSNDSARLFKRHMTFFYRLISYSGGLPAMTPRPLPSKHKKRPACDAKGAARATLYTPPLSDYALDSSLSAPGPPFGVTTRCTMIGVPGGYRPIRG